ncbi:hypothetical protein FB451DRAFT_1559665 [Mycena latifolia]|nr:hypothetical protein FB451DRAFT_1559665 [Mycena latifolia]
MDTAPAETIDRRRSNWTAAQPIQPPTGPAPVRATEEAGHAALAKLRRSKQSLLRTAESDTALQPVDEQDTFIAQLEDFVANLDSYKNPKSEARRRRHEVGWYACLIYCTRNTVPFEHAWHVETLKKYAKFYLPFLFKHTDPRPGRETLKAGTVEEWSRSFIENIAALAWDPETQTRAGMSVLTRGGLFHDLRLVLMNLINKNSLDRNLTEKEYYGRAEVQLVIQEILAAHPSHRRQGIQIIVRTLMQFVLALRRSSLAPANAVLRALDRYITLGHVRIFRDPDPSRFSFLVHLHCDQFKAALMTVHSSEMRFVLGGVRMATNTLFDLPVWLTLFLYARGALEIESFDQLLASGPDQPVEIIVKESMRHLPLFVRVKKGQYTDKVISAEAVSENFNYWAQKAGLRGGGTGTLRRDTGNHFGLQQGVRLAQDLLNHAISGVFRRHYSKNMANFDLVGLRLGEVAGGLEKFPGEKLQETLGKHAYMQCAVEALIRKQTRLTPSASDPSTSDPSPKKGKVQQRRSSAHPNVTAEQCKQAEVDAEASPEVQAALRALENALEALLTFFRYNPEATKIPRQDRRRSLRTRFDLTSGGVETRLYNAAQTDDDPIEFAQGVSTEDADLHRAIAAVKHSRDNLINKRRSARASIKSSLQRDLVRKMASAPVSGTVEERAVAVAALQADDSIARAAWAYSQGDQQEAYKKLDASPIEEVARCVPIVDEDDDSIPTDGLHSLLESHSGPVLQPEEVYTEIEPNTGDESKDVDVFNTIAVDDMRRAMMRWLYKPILDEGVADDLRERLQVKAAELVLGYKDGNLKCDACIQLGNPPPKLRDARTWRWHQAKHHSEFEALVPKAASPDTLFHCPAGDFTDRKRANVQQHLTTKCIHAAQNRRLLEAHYRGIIADYNHSYEFTQATAGLEQLLATPPPDVQQQPQGSPLPPTQPRKLQDLIGLLTPDDRRNLGWSDHENLQLVQELLDGVQL